MASKRQIAEALLNRLNGGIVNRDSKMTLRQVMFALDEARNFIIKQQIFQTYKEFQEWHIPFDIISEYEAKAVYDTNKKQWYVEMPVNAMSIYRGMGIYSLFQEGFEHLAYKPLIMNSDSLYHGTDAETVGGAKSYIPKGKKLWLRNVDFSDVTCDIDFGLKLVVDSHDIEGREDYKLSPELEGAVTEMALQKLSIQVQLPQDNVLDNLEGRR